MFFDEPADTIRGGSDWAHWALLAISTIAISPVMYLVTGWLTQLADKAAAALFLVA
jgi:NADH-quinone oxidoreductase subunit N